MSQCFYEETGYSVPPVLKETWYRDVFIFLVPTWYRSTGSFDNTTYDEQKNMDVMLQCFSAAYTLNLSLSHSF